MILISHRGNINQIIQSSENNPSYIENALSNGYDVEVDVRTLDGKTYLGHDYAQYNISINFLLNSHMWCHAKDINALLILLQAGAHCFYHETDSATLTSEGYIWTYPGQYLTDLSICVLPEISHQKLDGCYGICSNFIEKFKGTHILHSELFNELGK